MTGRADGAILDALLERLRVRAGLVFPSFRAIDIANATNRAMQRSGVEALDDYLLRLDDGRLSLSSLIEEVTVGETYFFREPEQFEFLRTIVVEDLRTRLGGRGPRVWSAACATGEEAYSLAFLLSQTGLEKGSFVLGTDISRDALTVARAGIYGDWSFRNAEGAAIRSRLAKEGARYRLPDSVRKLCTFAEINLAQPTYPSPRLIHGFDLILCRNVLIYLARDVIADIARRLHESLAEGGWLVAASSDPPLSHLAPFHVERTAWGVFYRRLDQARDGQAPPPFVSTPWTPAREAAPGPTPPTLAGSSRARAPLPSIEARPPGPIDAGAEAETAVRERPLDAEARYVLAMTDVAAGKHERAMESLRRAIYLDGSLVMAHLALGVLLQRAQDKPGASRAFRTVVRLCQALGPDAHVPLADGASPSHLAAVAETQLRLLSTEPSA